MQRLIDKDELLAVVQADMDVSVTGRDNMEAVGKMMKDILDDIAESPVVDAVPVIRCKDCVYCQDNVCKLYLLWTQEVNDDDYCSEAERKEK